MFVLTKDGTKIYTFVANDEYNYAYETAEYHYHTTGKDEYDQFYCYFLGDIRMLTNLSADSGICLRENPLRLPEAGREDPG